MRFILVSAEDPSIKRPVEVPTAIVRKRKASSSGENPRKKQKISKPVKPINKLTCKKAAKPINKTIQKTNSIIR